MNYFIKLKDYNIGENVKTKDKKLIEVFLPSSEF